MNEITFLAMLTHVLFKNKYFHHKIVLFNTLNLQAKPNHIDNLVERNEFNAIKFFVKVVHLDAVIHTHGV